MKNINATTIGNLISAHYEGDNEKFDAYVKFIIEAYEEQGEQRKADIIRKRADGSYKNQPKVVLDNTMKNYVYCIVDENGVIQKGEGSSNKTKFFEGEAQPQKWCDFYNRRHEDKHRVVKFKLVEVYE